MAIGDDFLPELFRGTEGPIYLCALRNNKSKLPPGEVAHIITRNLDKIEGFRDQWDRPEHEVGVYFSHRHAQDRRHSPHQEQLSPVQRALQ